MNSEGPAISVVMPVYNRADTVERAIKSVLAQEFADFELIVVDDGSKDKSVAIVEGIEDLRIKLVRQPVNAGSNAARNRGIREARAPLISFLDSDDAYLPTKLGFVVRTFTDHPELDLLLDSFTKEFPAGDPRRPAPRLNPVIDDTPQFLSALFNRRLWKATPAISVRRETAIKAGLFDESLKRRQDFDFLIRACGAGRCASTDQVTWTKTWMPGAISDDLRTFAGATVELCRRHPVYFENPEYRAGLARDVARHFARLLKAGRLGDIAADAGKLRRQFATAGLVRLIAEGSREILSRRRSRRTPGSDAARARNSE